MELGLTFPLQRFLGIKTPAWGTEPDRRFCWDLHVIRLRGRGCLLAVHCHSRYAFVRWDVPPLQREDIPGLFRAGLTDSLTAAGLSLILAHALDGVREGTLIAALLVGLVARTCRRVQHRLQHQGAGQPA